MDCLTVTVAQAAELLGLSEKTVRQMEASGALHRLKKLPGIRFNRQDILDAAGETEVSYRPREVQALRMEVSRLKAENERLKALYRQRLESALEDWKEVSESGQTTGAPLQGRGPDTIQGQLPGTAAPDGAVRRAAGQDDRAQHDLADPDGGGAQ